MDLREAFPLLPGTITAFVGGGGKTTLIQGLGDLLGRDGLKVVMTTTTRAYLPEGGRRIVRAEADLPRALGETSPVALVPLPPGVSKGPGLPPGAVETLLASGVADHILVEADGSRGRPFKGYQPGEPVVPKSAATVIPVLGVDLLGRTLGPGSVLRPERLAEVGLRVGEVCGVEEAAILFGHLLDLLEAMGSTPRVIPFLNKVEGERREGAARHLAREILRREDAAIERVIIGSVREDRFEAVTRGGGSSPPLLPSAPPPPS